MIVFIILSMCNRDNKFNPADFRDGIFWLMGWYYAYMKVATFIEWNFDQNNYPSEYNEENVLIIENNG